MYKKAILALGLTALLGCKGMSPDDYKVKTGRCKQDYECGTLCYNGFLGLDIDGARILSIENKAYSDKKEYLFKQGTMEIEMETCNLQILWADENYIEYKTGGK